MWKFYIENEIGSRLPLNGEQGIFLSNPAGLGLTMPSAFADIHNGFFRELSKDSEPQSTITGDLVFIGDNAYADYRSFVDWCSGSESLRLIYKPYGSTEFYRDICLNYANKSCPGDYLYERHGDIAAKVNAQLGETSEEQPEEVVKPTTPATTIQVKDLVEITGTKYYTGKTIPDWVKAKRWYVRAVAGERVVINKSEDGKSFIMSPVRASDLKVVTSEPVPETYRIHTVVKGDTLWILAKKYLNDGSRYTEIKALNSLTSDAIYIGMKLKMPN